MKFTMFPCRKKPRPPAAVAWQPSLMPTDWVFLHSPSMPETPMPTQNGAWAFDFPLYEGELPCAHSQGCPSVHYVTTKAKGPLTGAKSLTMSVEILASDGVIFEHRTEPNNTGTHPASVRLFLQRKMDGAMQNEFYRWWSNPLHIVLAGGQHSITVPLTPDQWSSVKGKKGGDEADPEATAGFHDVLANIENIGMTFGGGSFFGHGINVRDGHAAFALQTFSINRL